MSFVGVDIGASSTRYVSNTGEINELPNNMVHCDSTDSIESPDSEEVESRLEVKINKGEAEQKTEDSTKDKNFFPAHVLMGIMAEKYGVAETPNSQLAKFKQRNNFISIVVAVAMSKLKYGLEDDIDLYVAVPPSETRGRKAENEFIARLVGSFTVELPRFAGGVTVSFRIRSIKVFAESFMAVTSFFFDMSGRLREQAKNFLNGNILSIDIGASTTDLAIVQAGKLMERTGRTFRYGGNTSREKLSDSLIAKYDFDYPLTAVDACLREGRAQMGNSFVNESELVIAAKKHLSDLIMNQMDNYFKSVDVPVQIINAVVVSGGGSMQSQYVNENGQVVKTADSMSTFMTDKLTQWSKETVVLNYGEDARYANIKGLYIRAKIDLMRQQTQPAQAAQQVQTAQPVQAAQQVQAAQPVSQLAQAVNQPVGTAQPVGATQTVVDGTAQNSQPTQ